MVNVSPYAWIALALFSYQLLWFTIAIIKKRNDVADVAWGLGFVLLAWLAYAFGEQTDQALLVNILVTVWGVRLAFHIYARNRGKSEDFRYAQWRKEWQNFYVRSFLQVFMLQGFFLFVIAWPVMFVNLAAPMPWKVWDVVGVLFWLIGFGFESIGDYQLKEFKKNTANRGKIITTGLWRYTRHPNYFGEAVQWWGIFIIASSLPMGWITVVSPVLITYLLRYVSGVPMLERKYANHPDFEEYARRTSVFFPLPVKR
jgi:steroid 5-alpha reductase family enzyme